MAQKHECEYASEVSSNFQNEYNAQRSVDGGPSRGDLTAQNPTHWLFRKLGILRHEVPPSSAYARNRDECSQIA